MCLGQLTLHYQALEIDLPHSVSESGPLQRKED